MTVNVRIRVRHRYRAADAMERIRKRAEELKTQFAFFLQSTHAEWGRTMSLVRVNALSHAFTATIETTDRVAMLQIEMPEALGPMSDKLGSAVRRELRRALDGADSPRAAR
ncbi:MAG TPA: polyhydroxyalkanoic acid system family protein [Microvirga sp.]|nr:polyhydroxyalkanoic acid system family protein [Microvirga sp.]